jgi:serine kinase of HPr protein (carbohydrate metabolism regulator)
MKLRELVKDLNLNVLVGKKLLNKDVTGGYAGDMLSDVLANSKKGNIWVTMQMHPNILAVASSKDLSGIIITNGRMPESETLEKAEAKKIPILTSPLSTYKIVGRLNELGIE